ncbi:MAG: peptidoglycan-binding protein [Pseudorhodoplanes sp.]|nr:peptidoglycan-binding protein [Pseudorhodoplanes sp.]
MRVPFLAALAVLSAVCGPLFAPEGSLAQEARTKPAPAQRQAKPRTAKPRPPAAEAPNPAEQPAAPANGALREAYAALPLAERFAIQSDLIWAGDYNGMIAGDIGDRAIAAVKAFQKRNKSRETGILMPEERALLAESVREKQDQVGWMLVEDPVMVGVRLGIPAKLAPRKERGRTGGRWTSSRGEVQIETFRDSIADTTFAALFEQQKKTPAGRRTEYSVLRPDFFVLSGLQGLKKFYVRAQLRENEVRGIAILYDQAMDGIMEPVVVAMSSAFAPFAAGDALIGVKRNVEYATAVAASADGHLVTDRAATDGCHVIIVADRGHAERVAEDKAADLALIRVHGRPQFSPLALSANPPRGADLTLVGVGDPQIQNGGSAITATSIRIRGVEGGRVVLDPPPPLGFTGAAVIDGQGQFVGLTVLKPVVAAGPPAPPQAALASAAAIIRFLETNKVAPVIGSASVEAARASVVRLICVRK